MLKTNEKDEQRIRRNKLFCFCCKVGLGLNTENSYSEPIQNPNAIKIDIGMVQFCNGLDLSHSYVLELTIQNGTST